MLGKVKVMIRYFFRGAFREKVSLDVRPAPGETIPEKLKRLTYLEERGHEYPIVVAIRCDLEGKSPVLEFMKSYPEELEGELDNDVPTFT